MGERGRAIFIWLSGASRKILAECPTERSKYFGIGAAIFITGSMAGISLTFALVNTLKVPMRHAIIFAVFWGLAIMMIDRLFVVSMQRQRNPLIYMIQALPRLLMSIVLGLVISTPFVLQIFKPEITNEIQQMQAAQREAYFKGLATNPVYLTVQSEQATVNELAALAASGGSGINIKADTQLQNLESQQGHAKEEVAYWTNELNCQLYGGQTGGITCHPGYGPVGGDDQAEITTWQGQVTTLNREIATRTTFLQQENANQQRSVENTSKVHLITAEKSLKAAQAQLALQTQNVTSGINQDDGILAQLKALGAVTAGNPTLQRTRLLLFLLFLFIDILPVFIKLLINLTSTSAYDAILAGEEEMRVRTADNRRGVRQTMHHDTAKGERAGVRYRNNVFSPPLPGLRHALLRVNSWAKRREAEKLPDVAYGESVADIDILPDFDAQDSGWPRGPIDDTRASGSANGRTAGTGQLGTQVRPEPQTDGGAGTQPSSPSVQPDSPWRPRNPSAHEDQRWPWLSPRRLLRPGLRRPQQKPVPQSVPQHQLETADRVHTEAASGSSPPPGERGSTIHVAALPKFGPVPSYIGDKIMGNRIKIGNISGSNINIRSTLRDVTQTIGASNIDEKVKTRLEALLKELTTTLAQLPSALDEDAEAIASVAGHLVTEAVRERPNRKIISGFTETLRSLGSRIADVGPIVLEIIKLVNNIMGA